MISVTTTALNGCLELRCRLSRDERGSFVKTYHENAFGELGLNTVWREQFYSRSTRRVLRGLHFQTPPHDHYKLVHCVAGRVLDAALDIRRSSPTYGQHVLIELSADRANAVYLAPGFAHGFYVLGDEAVVTYMVSTVHAPESDLGVLWRSAGIPWPDPRPVVSIRDNGLPGLDDLDSPFP